MRPASLREPALFVLVSGVGWLADTAVFMLLSGPGHWPVVLANMVSGSCGALLVFAAASRGIFRRNGGAMTHKLAVLLPFNAVVILCASLALGLIAMLLAPAARLVGWDMPPDALRLAAKVLVTPVTLALNFVAVRFLVERFVSLRAPDAVAPLSARALGEGA